MLKNTLSRQMRDMNLQQNSPGGATGESQTTLGRRIEEAARRAELVRVTNDHKKMSADWLSRANQAAKRAWNDAQRQESQLSEDKVQGALNGLLDSQDGFLHQLHDTHTKASVCGPLRPDVVGCTPGQMLPVNTTIILELKAQTPKSPYNTPAHINQVRINPQGCIGPPSLRLSCFGQFCSLEAVAEFNPVDALWSLESTVVGRTLY